MDFHPGSVRRHRDGAALRARALQAATCVNEVPAWLGQSLVDHLRNNLADIPHARQLFIPATNGFTVLLLRSCILPQLTPTFITKH